MSDLKSLSDSQLADQIEQGVSVMHAYVVEANKRKMSVSVNWCPGMFGVSPHIGSCMEGVEPRVSITKNVRIK